MAATDHSTNENMKRADSISSTDSEMSTGECTTYFSAPAKTSRGDWMSSVVVISEHEVDRDDFQRAIEICLSLRHLVLPL